MEECRLPILAFESHPRVKRNINKRERDDRGKMVGGAQSVMQTTITTSSMMMTFISSSSSFTAYQSISRCRPPQFSSKISQFWAVFVRFATACYSRSSVHLIWGLRFSLSNSLDYHWIICWFQRFSFCRALCLANDHFNSYTFSVAPITVVMFRIHSLLLWTFRLSYDDD